MTKKEEVVDLKPSKISEEQLKKVQTAVNKMNRAQLEVGSVELRKHELLHGIANIKEELVKIQGELKEEYGTFDINVQDGTINYPKENGEANKED
jgi:hypothetical protein